MSQLEDRFHCLWLNLGGTPLQRELLLCPPRKWRFDFVDTFSKTVIEIEGGIWVRGAHTRGKHYNSDCEKYNTATLLGYKIFRLTTDQIISRHLVPIIDFCKHSIASHPELIGNENTRGHR